MELVTLDGGQAMNAIPAEAKAIVFAPADLQEIQQIVDKFASDTPPEWHAEISVKPVSRQEVQHGPIIEETRRQVIDVLNNVPNGVAAWSEHVPDLVETSSNLGVAKTTDTGLELTFSVRGSVGEKMHALEARIKELLEQNDFSTKKTLDVPGWSSDPNSNAVRYANEAYQAVTGKPAEVKGIHAGLETGYIVDHLRDTLGVEIPALSFGPTIKNPHSVNEGVDVKSATVFYQQLKETLRRLATELRQKPAAVHDDLAAGHV